MELLKLNTYNRIYQTDCFSNEFSEVVNEGWAKKAPYKRYQKKLLTDLFVLDEYGENSIQFPQFEELSDTKIRLFSIRHPKTKKNVRVIYAIIEGIIVLLTAFLEKNTSDYARGIRRAENRYKLLIK